MNSLLTRFEQYFANSPLRLVSDAIANRGFRAVVFGGSLRDLLVSDYEPRDIDIVIDAESVETLTSEFGDFFVRKTRFGGIRFDISGWAFDAWTLKGTWAFRTGICKTATFENLPKSTFLNVEAIAVDLFPENNGTRRIFSIGFFEALADRVVEINLEPNPFPDLCIVRALFTAARLEFAIGPKLGNYIRLRGKGLRPPDINRIQSSHYGEVMWDPYEVADWLDFVCRNAAADGQPLKLPVSNEKAENLRKIWSRGSSVRHVGSMRGKLT